MTHNILIADDEVDLELLISQKFRREILQGQYRFTFVHNGAEAYHKILENPDIDMVLTDIKMPVMGGLELLSQLSRLAHPPKTVVASAYGDMENIRSAMNNGAFDFLIKPFDFQDLTTTLEKTLWAVDEIKATQRRLKEAQIQAEKLSLLGQMVAGIAHEINNPVNFIYGNLEPALDYLQELMNLVKLYQQHYPDADSEIQSYIQKIDLEFLQADLPTLFNSLWMGTDRIRELVLSLRNFSRLDITEQKKVDLHKGIENSLLILNHRLKATKDRPKIQIERDFRPLPTIECYPNQINQVIMNIVVNAIDAIEEQNVGRTYSEIKDHPNIIQIQTHVVDDEYVSIVIKDNGPGIEQDILSQLFDPFFTTKPMGKGTGLGLSISQQIIEEKHGGRLSCDSIPGKGTKFVIELPSSIRFCLI